MRLDPRLTATALAHLLENAAQYAPAGSTIDVHATRDRRRAGRSRFAITARASRRPTCRTCSSGSIEATRRRRARRARAWACGSRAVCWRSNRAGSGRRTVPDGGAQFTIVVPAGREGIGAGRLADRMTPRSRILLVDDEVAIQRAVGPLLRSRGYDVDDRRHRRGRAQDGRRADAGSDRARSGPARSRRHRSLPARPRDVQGADRRALGAGRRGGQGERARSRRRRLRHQAVWPGGAAGAHSRGAAPRDVGGRCRDRPSSGPAT